MSKGLRSTRRSGIRRPQNLQVDQLVLRTLSFVRQVSAMRFNDTTRAAALAALLTAGLPGGLDAATFVVNDAGNASDSSAGNGVWARPNDACDADSGSNNGQNYPVVTSAATSG
jgi:hypothetical protein